MQIPRVVAVFNKYVNNRIQGLWAWLLPPWAVIGHTGRKSGRAYRTPILGFVAHGTFVVPILYGEQRPTGYATCSRQAAARYTARRGGMSYAIPASCPQLSSPSAASPAATPASHQAR